MKKNFILLLTAIVMAISFIGCSAGTSYKYETEKPNESVKRGVTYTVIDKDRQFVGYQCTEAFVYFFILKNETEYRVFRVDPKRYYEVEIGQSITVY